MSLFNDFEKIIGKCSANDLQSYPSSGLDLLINKKEESNFISNSLFSSSNLYKETKQRKIYAPFDSDPSQSRILKKVINEFRESVLCIDGPPGTGKTQLICNLISNCLIYDQKVAVVCEKDVALKVIHEKLNEIGIKHSAIKINELEQTTNVYYHVVEIEEAARKNKLQSYVKQEYEEKIADLEKRRSSCLARLSNYHKIQEEFHSKHGVLLGEVHIKANNNKGISKFINLIK